MSNLTPPSESAAPITAIVTAFQRTRQTLVTLDRITASVPPPAEILVHVDAGGGECAAAIRNAYPNIPVTLSETQVGPGGGRNRLIAEATQPLVASFDDDSYPIDRDYFARVIALFAQHPEATVIAGQYFHPGEEVVPGSDRTSWVADFVGGACAYRKGDFQKAGGYVPIPLAYGMEEVDLSLRLHAAGARILGAPQLRVFHDTDRARHGDPRITSATISNLALLAYLRYPIWLWGIGIAQCANRIWWLLTHGRRKGIFAGLARIPSEIIRYRRYAGRLPGRAVMSYLALRRAVHV